MIYSTSNQIVIFSPPKTGTKSRISLYHDICDQMLFHVPFVDFIKKHPEAREYTKMCFVRNPWNREISFFRMFHGNKTMDEQKKLFKKWIMSPGRQSMDAFYCNLHGNVAVDKVLQTEKWNESIAEINKAINFDPKRSVQNAKKYDVDAYKEWFDKEMIDFVASQESKTLDMFDYKFK